MVTGTGDQYLALSRVAASKIRKVNERESRAKMVALVTSRVKKDTTATEG